ncbi:DNA primase [Bowdeniella nasicola]|uniref:DNA primase n=1 Tax=Bowdeniella nasicola TaxID=208480 RepID=A0A1Q5Q364_9ACTO|nr:DNA primase [Bowdeniella nasicola]OKL54080.1 DNA primase [Bowdeniella nasicola]
MAGLIKREDIDQVRERTRIDEVVSQHVTLRAAGVGSMKGLCPFHDEKTPSFHVRPTVGRWHCFGCGEGGDVINFVQRINGITFVEAVEHLADRLGMQLRYEEGSQPSKDAATPGLRRRLLAAHEVAEQYYREQLNSPEAAAAREFLTQRGFTQSIAEHFGIGYAPQGWDGVLKHLRGRGFTEKELKASGLVSEGNRGVYDRFRGRVMWPIRDVIGATIGFGARHLYEADKGPKYLNTPETLIYKKSQVLYGLDLAKREIAQQRQIVIVEGYTDVMACHVAGVKTAVATCGTAFGADHVRVVRRLLGDSRDSSSGIFLSGKTRGGEVIFTFDGDAAGRKAALKAFNEDQSFGAQTFVAVEPRGLDPCDLWRADGDEAVHNLIAARQPLFEFVIHSALSELDLETAEGRVAGLKSCAPVVATIRDKALRGEYTRALAGWLGMDMATVANEVRTAPRLTHPERVNLTPDEPRRERLAAPDPTDPVVRLEAQALQLALQEPATAYQYGFDSLQSAAFVVPVYRALFEAIQAAGGTGGAGSPEAGNAANWLEDIVEQIPDQLASAVGALSVSPIPRGDESLSAYTIDVLNALLRMDLTRKITHLRGQLSRTEPSDANYHEIFSQLVALENERRRRQG